MRGRISTLLCAVLPIFAAACSSGHDSTFTLSGTIAGMGTDTILVTGIDARFDRVDTIFVEDGTFIYECELDTVTPLILIMSDGNHEVVFADKGLEAAISKSSTDSYAIVDGGKENLEYRLFMEKAVCDTSREQTFGHIDSLIRSNPFSEVAPLLIFRYYADGYAGISASDSLIRNIGGDMKDNSLIQNLLNEMPENRKATTFGDVDLYDTTMTKTTVKDLFKTDNVLFYFWASWDLSYKSALDSLKSIDKKFEDRNLKIVGITLDTNSDRWKEAVAQDSLEWEQYTDRNGWNGKMISQLNLHQLPCYVLVGRTYGNFLAAGTDLEDFRIPLARLNKLDSKALESKLKKKKELEKKREKGK